MIDIDNSKLEELLYGVSFHKRKTEYIKKTSQMIKDEHEGKVPEKLDEILKFPGVGIKMAILLQQSAFGLVEGISVDTHVHRISNLFEWADSKTPEGTMKQLQEWVPKEKWSQINHMLVGFGQTICKPIAPLCDQCKINDICPKAFWYAPKKLTEIQYEETKEEVNEDKNQESQLNSNSEKKSNRLKFDEAKTKIKKKTLEDLKLLNLSDKMPRKEKPK